MAVDVDEPGRDDLAGGVELPLRLADDPDLDDAAVEQAHQPQLVEPVAAQQAGLVVRHADFVALLVADAHLGVVEALPAHQRQHALGGHLGHGDGEGSCNQTNGTAYCGAAFPVNGRTRSRFG